MDIFYSENNNTDYILMWQETTTIMQCAVYDTYVTKKDNRVMHFDVIVKSDTPQEKAIEFGKKYLESVGEGDQKMTQEECQFCHIQEAPKIIEKEIEAKGYYIQQMEGCSF
jgi:hypothetical protein